MINDGDDLSEVAVAAMAKNEIEFVDGDVLVIAQKIVSKSEGQIVNLSTVEPSHKACEVAKLCKKDPKLVELILSESSRIVRCSEGVLIVQHHLGWVMANAGIDQSNVRGCDDEVLLLPKNPNASAQAIKESIYEKTRANCSVVINDSFGRPFRMGTAGVCIGHAGFSPLEIKTGSKDLFGRELQNTEVAIADEIASAASLIMGQADEGCPMVVIKGLNLSPSSKNDSSLVRPENRDLFL